MAGRWARDRDIRRWVCPRWSAGKWDASSRSPDLRIPRKYAPINKNLTDRPHSPFQSVACETAIEMLYSAMANPYPTIIPNLRSPFDQVKGIVYFGRMLDKIRLFESGKLPEG